MPFEGFFGLHIFFKFLKLMSLVFNYIFLEKSLSFCAAGRPFPIINFPSLFPRLIPLSIFRISDFWEKIKLLITLD